MSRWDLICKLRNLLGRDVYTQLQSFLKYWQRFWRDYALWGKRSQFQQQTYVFMIDGKTLHGGISDRFRGAMSVYSYCKKYNKQFKICWTSPFNLSDFLVPRDGNINWEVTHQELSFNLNDVSFKYFNSYSGLNGKEEEYYRLLKSRKREVHVYSNVSIEEDCYHIFFNKLFKPDSQLSECIETCLEEIGGNYISITFRFIGLLGDFKDDTRFLPKKDSRDAEFYIQNSLNCIKKLHNEYSTHKILVTSDSSLFLQRAMSLNYVYVIPGKVIHPDRTMNADHKSYLKSFVDFFMISKADRCFIYSIGAMYRSTRFAKTAALVGGKELFPIIEEG